MANDAGQNTPPAGASRSRLIVQGITWTAAYQLLEVALSFGSMLLLVRVLDARDYGRAAVVTGLLALLATFNSHVFVEHALQQPDGEEPDWQLHWTVAVYIQAALSLVAHGIAGICWLLPDYRPIAALMHLAAFGVLLEAPSQISATMLRRDLNLRRLRIVSSLGMMLRLTTTTTLGLAGAGAYAIVIGGNVVPSLPLVFDLLFVRRWWPRPGWYRRFSWADYSAAGRFGLQRAGATVIGSLRGAAESAVLPAPLGFAAVGLINRAQALYTTTFGRVGNVLADAVYPFLPRSSQNRVRYASHATMYVRVMLLISVPAALFVSEYGTVLSRVLYGQRWVSMDPLIRPGALASLSISVLGSAAAVLMAAGRVRDCLVYEAIAAIVAIPALAVAWFTRDAAAYSWACAIVEAVVAVAAMWRASTLLQRDWLATAVAPPFVSGVVALWFLRLLAPWTTAMRPLIELTVLALVYAAVNLIVLRVGFAAALHQLLEHAPGGHHLRRLARLRTVAPPAPAFPEA